jgi:hypothetical protein
MGGIRLTDAMDGHFDGPDQRDDPMFVGGGGASISCRLNVRVSYCYDFHF